MEDWELGKIENNFSRLLSVTSCNTVVKAWLNGEKFITNEEMDRLTTLGRTCTRFEETKELYAILKTRIGGYQALINVLEETRQTGALHILRCRVKGPCNESSHAEMLLDTPVRLSGTETLLRNIFPDLTIKEIKQILRDQDLNRELNEILEKEAIPLQLGGEEPSVNKLYIPRSISNRLLLDPKLFDMKCSDVFVFEGFERSELCSLVEPNVVRSSTNQRTKITSRYIYLDDDEDWCDLVTVCESPIHLVSRQGKDFVLQRSSKITQNVLTNTLKVCKQKDAFISEDEFVNQIIGEESFRGALVCDVPGMGKTWLMQSIATKLQNKSDKSVVFFVSLAPFGKFLRELNNLLSVDGCDNLKYALQHCCSSNLVVVLLLEHARQNKASFIFICDGFDEMLDVDVEATALFLRNLNSRTDVKLIVSSRPHMRTHLERTFEVASYDILPFETEDQVKTIVGHWMECIPEGDVCKLSEFANNCIDGIHEVMDKERSDILGVPLKCYLLAIVNERHARLLCNPNRRKPIRANEIATVHSVANLFDQFVSVSIAKMSNQNGGPLSEDCNSAISHFHTFKALDLLFPTLAEPYRKNFHINASEAEQVVKIGVLYSNTNNELEFYHRSFAEYFAGKFFAKLWMNTADYELDFRETVLVYFIKRVLQTEHAKKFICRSVWFKYSTVLWFVNSFFENLPEALVSPNMILCGVETTSRWITYFEDTGYFIWLACLTDGLIQLFIQLIHVVKHLFEGKETKGLLHPPKFYTNSLANKGNECVSLLLCSVADSGSPESAQDFFDIFKHKMDNHLLKFCANYPLKYFSPLEIAIYKNDIDMAMFFVNKTNLPMDRLFYAWLTYYGKDDQKGRLLLMERALGGEKTLKKILQTVKLTDFLDSPQSIYAGVPTTDILTAYAWKHKLSSKGVIPHNKTKLIEISLDRRNRVEVIKLFLWLFGKEKWESHDISRAYFDEETASNDLNVCEHSTEDVLGLLDLADAKETLLSCNFYDFEYFKSSPKDVDKFLEGIDPNFPNCVQISVEDEFAYKLCRRIKQLEMKAPYEFLFLRKNKPRNINTDSAS